jgi:hypothetical protein
MKKTTPKTKAKAKVDNVENLESLIKNNKPKEAEKMLQSFLEKDPTPEERGEMYVAYLSAYVNTTKAIQDRYEGSLKNTIKSLEEINQKEKELSQKIELQKAKIN